MELDKRLDLLSEIAKNKAEVSDQLTKLSTIDESLSKSRAEANEYRAKTSALDQELSGRRAETNELSLKLRNAEAELAKAKDTLKSASELEKEIAILKARNKILEENEASLKTKVASLSTRVGEAVDAHTALSSSRIEDEKKISSLSKTVAEKEREIVHLRSEMSKLCTELEVAKSQSPDLEAIIQNLEQMAITAITSSLGQTHLIPWLYAVVPFDPAVLKNEVGNCKAVHSCLCHLPINWPQEKIHLVEMAKHLLGSFLHRHADVLEAGVGNIPSGTELPMRCRFVSLVLTHVLEHANWDSSTNDFNSLTMVIGRIPKPNSA